MLQVKAAQEILWYRDKHLLNSSGRGGISITTDKVMVMMMFMMSMMMMIMIIMIMLMIIFENWLQTGVRTVKTRGVGQQVPIPSDCFFTLMMKLLLRLADSGEYFCKPSNALPDSVAIHVLTGFEIVIILIIIIVIIIVIIIFIIIMSPFMSWQVS